jgi:(p)ppGpp synthase/HD superfamily hydrolase
MTVMTPPRPPIVETAMMLARRWCKGHIIDQAPAFSHAVRVAEKLVEHWPDAPAMVAAAALLHDAPEFAPSTVDLAKVLTELVGYDGQAIAEAVRRLHGEHLRLDAMPMPPIKLDDRDTVVLSAADKVVALDSMLRRAARAHDVARFWAARPAFLARVAYFRAFTDTTATMLPCGLLADLDRVVHDTERATTAHQPA